MTPQDTIAALVKLGVEIDPVNAKLVLPPSFTQRAELADLIPLVGMHRSAILSEILEPWPCQHPKDPLIGCGRTFFVPAVDVREFIGSPHYCDRAACPLKRGS